MNQNNQHKWQWNGWIVALFLFFLVVVVVNGTMAYFSQSSWTGVTEEHHYERGLAYNKEIEAYHKQVALGWKGTLTAPTSWTVGQSGRLQFLLTDAQGKPVSHTAGVGVFFRPIPAGYDQPLRFTEATNAGEYYADVVPPLPGFWEVKVEFTKAQESYRLEQRIQLLATGQEKGR